MTIERTLLDNKPDAKSGGLLPRQRAEDWQKIKSHLSMSDRCSVRKFSDSFHID